MKIPIYLFAVAISLSTATSSAFDLTSKNTSGTVATAASQPATSIAYTKKSDRNEYGSIDGQSPLERYELVAKSNAGDCHATFTRSLSRGNEATVLKTTYERGGLMERYYIKEQGGRWYYASHFSAVRCK